MNDHRIVINDEWLENAGELQGALEELYLGSATKYQIYLQKKHLTALESIFDQIIQKYGMRKVEFEYFLRQSLSAG